MINRFLAVVAILGLLLAAGAFIRDARTPDDPGVWEPLGDYPVQQVQNENNTVSVDERLIVKGTKCNNEEFAIRVEGRLVFRRLVPLGATVIFGEGVDTRLAGCVTQTFENVLPGDVIRDVESLGKPSVWQIDGVETPVAIDGRRPVPATFVSEPFTITP